MVGVVRCCHCPCREADLQTPAWPQSSWPSHLRSSACQCQCLPGSQSCKPGQASKGWAALHAATLQHPKSAHSPELQSQTICRRCTTSPALDLSHRCCPPGAQVTAAHRCSGLLGALEYPVCDHISPHSGGLISACSAKGCSPALDAQQGRPHHHQTSITAEACATLLACTGCSTDLAPPPSGRMAP